MIEIIVLFPGTKNQSIKQSTIVTLHLSLVYPGRTYALSRTLSIMYDFATRETQASSIVD